jgi:probable HAF family extracellular repeat protein
MDDDIDNATIAYANNGSKIPSSYTYTPINHPGAVFTVALGVNDMSNGAFMNSSGQSGQIVGWYSDSTSTHGFLFDGLATWTQIDYPGAQWTNADGISNSGQIVGTYFDSSGYHGFQWNAGAPTKIDYPGAVGATQVFAINDAGQIVGYYQDSTNAWHGFLYYAGKFYPINYSGATGTFVAGINGDGVVSGYYYGSPNGFFYYPQPPTWTGPVQWSGLLRRGERNLHVWQQQRQPANRVYENNNGGRGADIQQRRALHDVPISRSEQHGPVLG